MRRRLAVAAATGLGLALLGVQTSAFADSTISSPGPLTSITISPVLNCAVNHTGDTRGEWYSDIACGTFVAFGGHLYGPASVPAGESATGSPGYVAYTAVSQTPVTGSGTAASPYTVTTVVGLGGTARR